MHNLVYAIGRITQDLEIKELEDGRKECLMTLAVQRSYKNEDGIYETDIVPCVMWNAIADNVKEYCKAGDLVGIKGRVKSDPIKNEDGTITYDLKVIAEKVSFLASKKKEEDE